MAEEVLIPPSGKITSHLTASLLAVAFLTSFGSSMLYGYNLAVVNSPAVYIKDFYNKTVVGRNGTGLSEETLTLMYSLTVSVFAVGGLLGSLIVGMLVTRYGRKGTVVNTTVLVFIAALLMGFSRICGSPEMIIIGRFITGIHSGISLSVVPMYLGEIAPKNLRGFLGLVPSIFIGTGVFVAQILGLHELLGKEEHWPLFLSVIAVPTFIQLMLLPWFPESPRYLLIEKHNIHATIRVWSPLKSGTAMTQTEESLECGDYVERALALKRSHSHADSIESAGCMETSAPGSDRDYMDKLWFAEENCAKNQVEHPQPAIPLSRRLVPEPKLYVEIWFYTNSIFENAGIPAPEIQYTTAGTGIIEIIAGLIGEVGVHEDSVQNGSKKLVHAMVLTSAKQGSKFIILPIC
ncbi:solute carrier family 2 member 15a [Pundamilia nyererei]|uniref:Solute carrier family 2 member 15a n=1 Tax=Pundamilia nyererei TaxID=303518 RepID=A0A9Y3VQH2_9CICH|nr:PREDICTED: solute carrier family 2, facilitated glucose transporter member 5-like [Pundamilia nyererei]